MNKSSRTLLIIEDDPTLLKHLTQAFAEYFSVTVAATGTEGLEKIGREKPMVVLLDLSLPDINGIDILKKIKTDQPAADQTVIVLTNNSDPDMVSQVLAAGGRDYIVKADWAIADIVKKVEEILDQK